MPIYEYQCQSCAHQMEALQKMSDPSLSDCPECGQSELKKLVSAPSFKLTGTGWYETDFKNSKKDDSKSNNSGDSATGSSSETTSKSDNSGGTAKASSTTDSAKKASTSGSAKAAD